MSITKIPQEEYIARRAKIKEKLAPGELALVFSGDEVPMWNEINYPFEVDRNFYYLTGVAVPGCVLSICNFRGNITECLYVPREGDYEIAYFGVKPDEFYRERSGIAKISRMENFNSSFMMMNFMLLGVSTIYTMSGNRAHTPHSTENHLLDDLRRTYPYIPIRSLADDIFRMRVVKSQSEIALLQEAISVTDKGLRRIMGCVAPGMYEYEVQAHFNFVATSSGCIHAGTITSIQGGQNANKLHYMENHDVLKDGDLLLMDVSACKEYYCSDVSRTIPVNGKFTEMQKHWYSIVLKCADMVIAGIKPGQSRQGLNTEARALLSKELREAGLIAENQPINVTTARNWGACNNADHPIGLLCHDVGDSDVLLPGMVYTVEPGVYLKDLGFGIRIEDDILITEDGAINLSAGIPRTVEEIEAAMANR